MGYDTSYVVGFDGQEVPTITSYSNSDGEVHNDATCTIYDWGHHDHLV